MEQKVASKNTIDILINNIEKTIVESENILHNVEQIKSNLYNKDSDINFLQLLFELLSGSLSGIYEVCHSLKNMLLTDNIYIKRYHMQMINLSQYEWCKYLAGKDKDGILFKLKNYLNKNNYSCFELENILTKTRQLGENCNINLRNITAHYDKPYKMYLVLVNLNDENIYALRINVQLLIHEMILKYASLILRDIQIFSYNKNKEVECNKKEKSFDIIDALNNEISKAFDNKADFYITVTAQLLNAWNDIEMQRRKFFACDKIIKYFKLNRIDCKVIKDTQAVVEMYWCVSFMKYDLMCSINSYLNASSNIERSICFMRAFRITTSALFHLYGYDEQKRKNSIWNKIKLIPEFDLNESVFKIENKFESLISNFDYNKRNLYTHYREGEKLNITDRWQSFKDMDHTQELILILEFITLCKSVNQFLVSLVLQMDFNEKLGNNKILENYNRKNSSFLDMSKQIANFANENDTE